MSGLDPNDEFAMCSAVLFDRCSMRGRRWFYYTLQNVSRFTFSCAVLL